MIYRVAANETRVLIAVNFFRKDRLYGSSYQNVHGIIASMYVCSPTRPLFPSGSPRDTMPFIGNLSDSTGEFISDALPAQARLGP